MWDIGEKTIAELIELVDNSELALPQFQRPSVWGRLNWIPFLRSILLGRPTGTLLLMEAAGAKVLAPRSLETAPKLIDGRLKFFLLDGQQRTTTLYCATRTSFGSAPRVKKAVVDIRASLINGELTDDEITMEPAGSVAAIADMAQQGTLSFSTLINDAERAIWQQMFVEQHFQGDVGRFVEEVAKVLPGFNEVRGYRFPILLIRKDTPLDVVAEIFESMNRRGQPLNKFDLMVARLYHPLPRKSKSSEQEYFDLRSMWLSALEKSPHLRQVGIKADDGMLPLQLIAKQVSRLSPGIRGAVKGMNSADVLELPPDQVTGTGKPILKSLNLKTAVLALEAAAKFLVDFCGVVAPSLLPQQAMLLPLADQFLLDSNQRLGNAELKKWFFAAGLLQHYYGGVNSYANTDCNRLMLWADPKNPQVPESVLTLTKSYVQQLNFKDPFTRAGNILGRSVFALLVANGALDWAKGQIKVDTFDEIDYHHMVPEQKLKDWFKSNADDRRPIAGMTPIGAATNRKIGNLYPKDVMKSLEKDAGPTMKSHRIDKSLLDSAAESKGSFEKFVADREKKLKEFIVEALGLA